MPISSTALVYSCNEIKSFFVLSFQNLYLKPETELNLHILFVAVIEKVLKEVRLYLCIFRTGTMYLTMKIRKSMLASQLCINLESQNKMYKL